MNVHACLNMSLLTPMQLKIITKGFASYLLARISELELGEDGENGFLSTKGRKG